MGYLDWLENRKSPTYPDANSNHFGLVQLEPITAYIRGLRVQVRLSGSAWDQIERTVTWKDIDREGLDGMPGTRTMASGHVACFRWIKKHVVQSTLRSHWLHFFSWYNIGLFHELEAERKAAWHAINDAEIAAEIAERKAAAKAEEQRLADIAANNPLKLFSSGKIKRTARFLNYD